MKMSLVGRRVPATEKANRMCKPSYTPSEAAIATGLDLSHIDHAIREGDLPARLVGHQIVVTKRDVNDWLRRQPLLVLPGIGQ